jgi:Flp pilus assembly pilin Flp
MYHPYGQAMKGEDTDVKRGSVREDCYGLVFGDTHAPGLGAVGCGRAQTNDQRGSYMVRRLLKDESGQTMLEYIVIVVFVVIAAIIGFRLVKGIVKRSVDKASMSIEQ